MGFEGRVEPLRLLDLVCAVQDVAASDREVVAALQHLLDPPADREPPRPRAAKERALAQLGARAPSGRDRGHPGVGARRIHCGMTG